MNVRTLMLFAVLGLVWASQPLPAGEWPQWRGRNRDGVWAETGLIDQFSAPEVPIKWRVPISAGYSGPTVAAGRVYVTDRVAEPGEIERVHCFDAATGETIWSHSYDCRYEEIGYKAGPRASVLVEDDRAYSLGAAGHLFCFNAATGEVLWSRDLRTEYSIRMPIWGIAAAPLVEGDLLIVKFAGDEACVGAFDKLTGEERWTALADDGAYSAPIVIEQAGRRVLVCWTGNRIVGLDPQSGQLHWEHPTPWERWPINIATPVLHNDLLVLSDAHKGTLVLRLSQEKPAVELVWHRRRQEVEDGAALHCLISTPFVDGQHIYGADGRGVLRCLRLDTGEQIWEDRSAVPENNWATIHLIRNHDRTWLFNERGELIIARLTPAGFDEISRAKLIDPTLEQLRRRDGVTWSHPAFAHRHVFARNDKELVCADLSAAEFSAAPGDPVRTTIVLLHDNDMHFNFNHREAFAAKVGEVRSRCENVFLLNAGDVFIRDPDRWNDPRPEYYSEQSQAMIAAMNSFRYDAMTLGNHELAYIDDLTRAALDQARFPLLAANIEVTTEHLPQPKPFVVLEASDGVTVAVLGLAVASPKEGVRRLDPLGVAREYEHLREKHNVLVGLTHLGFSTDSRLAEAMDVFDVIIGGHSHTLLEEAVLVNGVLIAQAGGTPSTTPAHPDRPKYLGEIVLVLEDGKVVEKRGHVHTFAAETTEPADAPVAVGAGSGG
ncbi:MAG: PQQ-binding-like beta-propeller repeat protein [Thermoguttaceae bacterium]|nr:PQQ-binding-like beta-propeller repeat protein [Thermoguttaceae bacterium]